ncbi:MAG: deoxyribodipyrimidine photo-lyase [Thermosynechococcaceae cyanobacterium MS004]|nr:deoxyribodipyrimidine photo-lyase [Thermosynechococcaceae cyanobacterium MS004]
MAELVLFWHRRDLRILDNVGLSAARARTPRVVGVFCLDSGILDRDDMAPVRVTYMMGCLQALEKQYEAVGSQLIILKAKPEEGIPRLARALNVDAVFWNQDVEPYAQARDRRVIAALQQNSIAVSTFWDQLLHAPGEILTNAGEPYTVYSPFWRNWSSKTKLEPCPTFRNAQGLTADEHAIAIEAGILPLPTAPELGFVWDAPLIVDPGEQAAKDILDYFCQNAIAEYQENRNYPAVLGTSLLSAPLKFGVIGIRTLWAATTLQLEDCRSDEVRASIQTWRQELAWREFYQHVLYAFPALADGPYRPLWQTFPWQGTDEQFEAWCTGQTGYPIVDAAMRQLNQTGWMHNRCRMIVASFLTKDLIINWQRGEKYFMQNLIDGDLAANNGGWQWSASSGMDPKPLRIFNPASQAQKFDPEAEYIREWLPELRSVDPEYLVTGKIPADQLQRTGYPQPIVDHAVQQRLFKQLYQQQKEG